MTIIGAYQFLMCRVEGERQLKIVMICHNSFLIKHLLPNFCSTHTEVIRIFMWSIIRNALPLLLLVNFNFTIDTEATSLNTMGVNVFSKSLQLEKGNYDAILSEFKNWTPMAPYSRPFE